MQEEAGIGYIRIDGGTKVKDRQPLCDTFQANRHTQVALLSITAAGTCTKNFLGSLTFALSLLLSHFCSLTFALLIWDLYVCVCILFQFVFSGSVPKSSSSVLTFSPLSYLSLSLFLPPSSLLFSLPAPLFFPPLLSSSSLLLRSSLFISLFLSLTSFLLFSLMPSG